MQKERKFSIADELIAQERAVLDRWYRGDPKPFLENCAPSVTYFDPTVPQAINGWQALETHLLPLTGKVMIDHYEIENPVVQLHGETAVLTFNCVVYIPQEDGTEKPMYNWNATEVYARIDNNWKVIHSNWAYSKPVDSLV
jgi:ketosteroid isomerase-like protein